jgi:hypothetical protein
MITTPSGSTVSIDSDDYGNTMIVLDHPDAPEDMRKYEVGRIVTDSPGPVDGKGFQPVPFCLASMSPAVLRAIADLMEGAK